MTKTARKRVIILLSNLFLWGNLGLMLTSPGKVFAHNHPAISIILQLICVGIVINDLHNWWIILQERRMDKETLRRVNLMLDSALEAGAITEVDADEIRENALETSRKAREAR